MASVWAIGDIHGETGRLDALLGALNRGTDDVTLFIGDYIDRGPDSAGAVQRVLAEYDAAPERTILLWGNHEDLAAAHFGKAYPSGLEYDPYDWYRNGAIETMRSYGYEKPEDVFGSPCPDDLDRLFSLLKTFWQPPAEQFPGLAHCIYVHAGVLPGIPPERSRPEILLWVREDFLEHTDTSGRVVIHGHTPFKNVRVKSDKIGIDTGAAYGGLLTCLQLPERRIYQADAEGYIEVTDLL